MGEATIAGYFLGRDVQKRGYNIGPAVAAHMWNVFTLLIGSFLINQKNNFLGVNLKFKICIESVFNYCKIPNSGIFLLASGCFILLENH